MYTKEAAQAQLLAAEQLSRQHSNQPISQQPIQPAQLISIDTDSVHPSTQQVNSIGDDSNN